MASHAATAKAGQAGSTIAWALSMLRRTGREGAELEAGCSPSGAVAASGTAGTAVAVIVAGVALVNVHCFPIGTAMAPTFRLAVTNGAMTAVFHTTSSHAW